MMLDTRVITALDDAKAGAAAAQDGDAKAAAAAWDDARCSIHELLHEGPAIPSADWSRLVENFEGLNEAIRLVGEPFSWSITHAVNIADRVFGSLTRIADRWNQ
ncbi:hypothetical protein I5I01_gp61 [Mycobacterium phage MooMoo]|uniref:Uncharacterized protein n=1 Tax=Mycobacterium phage MooMoo TaxID=2108127 RepID=A0A2P1JR82_9CAUD|nr:hypothetical protein I5I01_gp61 [Mycobacterium phage MooMoo]AVO21666.1 hypothetical protein SEA_MOOMOO_61 [Mycobacterium phage MooMoo]